LANAVIAAARGDRQQAVKAKQNPAEAKKNAAMKRAFEEMATR
jgi:hypothetical protein